MKVFYSEAHSGHDPKGFISAGRLAENPEVPERAERLLQAVQDAGHQVLAPAAHGPGPLAQVHTLDYLDFLEHGHGIWSRVAGASPEIIPNAHPGRHMRTRPDHIIGLAGYHMADTACPIGAGTWDAARAAADCALTAADRVLGQDRVAYALCRPPGHHAFADMAGGFCFLNNVAIAAEHCRDQVPRVAILDIDVHHGNGTQGIFAARGDVFFASIHADPARFYPWFAGYAHERGVGAGLGFTLNLPQPKGAGDEAFHGAIDRALDRIARFAPGVLLISLGFDAQENDPLGILKVTTAGFREAGGRIAGAGLPTVLIQEGGYLCPELGANLAAFLAGFEAAAA